MTSPDRAAVEARLAIERDRVAESAASLVGEHRAIIEGSAGSNLDDEHDPEGSTVGFERALVASLLADARRRLKELDEAIARVEDGTYGVCERCGQEIPDERLAAQPTATRCVTCARLG